MEEKLFDNWNFIYENSDDVSLRVMAFRDGEKEPCIVSEASTEQLKNKVGSGFAYHIELFDGFELTVHAIKDNMVYVRVLERTAEYGWRTIEHFVLNKSFPAHSGNLVLQLKTVKGTYSMIAYPWGKLKSGLRTMV